MPRERRSPPAPEAAAQGAWPACLIMAGLAALYLIVWIYLDPRVRYHALAPPFFLENRFLRSHLAEPGGPLAWVSAGLAQLDHLPGLGGLITVLCLVSLAWASRQTTAAFGVKARLTWLGPPSLVFAIYLRYDPGVYELAGGLWLALGAVRLWARCPRGPTWSRGLILAGATLLLFYLAGPCPAIELVALAILGTALADRDAARAPLFGLALVPWLVARRAYPSDWLDPVPGVRDEPLLVWVGLALYAWVPLTLGAALSWRLARRWLSHRSSSGSRTATPSRSWLRPWVKTGLAATGVAALALTIDSEKRALLRIQSLAEHKDWRGVLRTSATLRSIPPTPARLQIHRALFHSGRLRDGLFAFPQPADTGMLASLTDGLDVCLPLSDTLLELGHVNLAERYAHEFLEIRGERPELLWRLAWINLVKERPQAARVFLKRMSKVPFHSTRARDWLARLADGRYLEDPALAKARSRRPGDDQIDVHFSAEALLRNLLKLGVPNPMAAEYLMAEFHLRGQQSKVTELRSLLSGPTQNSGERPVVAATGGTEQASAAPEPGSPRLSPDYSNVTIPPNIAPLNFTIAEPGVRRHRVRLVSTQGKPVEIEGKEGRVRIPIGAWQGLVQANAGKPFYAEIAVEDQGGSWRQLERITNWISSDPIDGYLIYRLLRPVYNIYGTIGVYQRRLGDYQERPLLANRQLDHGCLNCHTFLRQSPTPMALHIRNKQAGNPMLLVETNQVTRVDKTSGYISWHPSGHALAFSVNKFTLLFHTQGETRDLYDAASDIGLLHLHPPRVVTPPVIGQPDRLETWPHWAPDGKHLYFCAAPKLRVERQKQIRYDLMRVAYDLETDAWGEPELLLSSRELRISAAQPRVSPDGKWLLFCGTLYGNFPAYSAESDLYLMDLKTRAVRRVDELNSLSSESWHAWSSNGRWLVFSSKRRDGLFTRPYIAHMLPDGRFSKPWLLPWDDPEFYDSCTWTFNLPEFITGPVSVTSSALAEGVFAPRRVLKPTLASDAPSFEHEGEEVRPAPAPQAEAGGR